MIIRIQRPSTRKLFTALKLCEPPETCITASVRPCVGRTEPSLSGSQSTWVFITPVRSPCRSGPSQTCPSDRIDGDRSSCACDLALRVGGEEFALLLADTDRAGGLRVARKVHAEVSNLTVGSAGLGAGSVTVSIGVAATSADRPDGADPALLFRVADAALYESKAGGRNPTRCAPPANGPRPVEGPSLRLVGT